MTTDVKELYVLNHELFTKMKNTLALSASICTGLQFLAGILVCRKYIKNGTTGNSSPLAFITCFMSCSLWLRYGFLINDSFIMFVNLFGMLLQISYIIIFILYSLKRRSTLCYFTTAIFFVLISYLYSIIQKDQVLVTKYIGFLSCSLTVLFFASPLTLIIHVLSVRSTESLPFPIILASTIVSFQWLVYGVWIDDQFILIPNFLGFILCLIQLFLFGMFRKKQLDEHEQITYFI